MKKYGILIPFMALLLSGCGAGEGGKTNHNLQKDFVKDLDSIMLHENYSAKAFYQYMDSDNSPLTPCGVLEQYNKSSVIWIDEENPSNSIGVLENGSKGMFEYTLATSGDVVLGNFLGFSGGYSMGTYFETPAQLCNSELWTLSQDKTCYECRDENLVNTFVSLTELETAASKKGVTYIYGMLRASYEGDSLVIKLNGARGESVAIRGELRINNIGDTHNEKIENFVKTEQPVAGRTDWTVAEQVILKKFFGGNESEPVPFPDGASYALKVTGLDEYGEAMINDVASGDISRAYLSKLEAEGYTVVKLDTYYLASKSLTKGASKIDYQIYVTYYSKADITANYGAETASLYPLGRFQIEVSASKQTDTSLMTGTLAEFEAWMDSKSAYNFPKTGWTNVTAVQYADRTVKYNGAYAGTGISYQFVSAVKFFVESETNALSNYNAYRATLLGLGFEETSETEGNLTFVYFKLGKYEVDLSINYNGSTYGGFIQAMYWVED